VASLFFGEVGEVNDRQRTNHSIFAETSSE